MILVIILYFLFASTFILGKSVLMYVTPFLFIGIRMMLGGSILLGYVLCAHRKKFYIHKKDIFLFARIIFFHIFCAYTLEFWALENVTAAKACLLYNLSPFITAVFSYFLIDERLSKKQIIGLIIGFLGFIPILSVHTSLEMLSGNIGFLSLNEIALIVSVISSAYGWMIMKKLTDRGYSFIFVNGIGMTGGGILAFILSLYKEGWPQMKPISITVLPYITDLYGSAIEQIIIIGGYSVLLILIANIICYNLYGYLLSRYSPTFLSFSGFMTPLFALILEWIFYGEMVSWHFFATMLCVIVGLSLFHEKKEIYFEEKGL